MWIEILEVTNMYSDKVSRPVRALWIEITDFPDGYTPAKVEAREGLVD